MQLNKSKSIYGIIRFMPFECFLTDIDAGLGMVAAFFLVKFWGSPGEFTDPLFCH